MAVRIKFDNTHNVIEPTLVTASRNGAKHGIIPTRNVKVSDALNAQFDLSFTVEKKDVSLEMWNQVENFKLCWCPEWDVWFEMYVEKQEEDAIRKNVTCISLCEAELGQIMIYDFEANTEDDIKRKDYAPRILWTPTTKTITKKGRTWTIRPEDTLLYRLLDKAPHYTIGDIDTSLQNISREFTFNGVSIYDALQEVAQELDCIFIFDSGTDANGNIKRTINAYDLEYYCHDCGHRSVYEGPCSECGSVNVVPPYGSDTNIFVNTENLADNVTFSTDTGAVKNCFRLTAGDDLMTAAVTAINPTQSNYIYYFTDEMKEDMSDELRAKIDTYYTTYDYYQSTYPMAINSGVVTNYNSLVNKYGSYDENLETISSPIVGYKNLMKLYYNAKSLEALLGHTMMPSVETQSTDAQQEAAKLYTALHNSNVAVRDITASKPTVESCIEFAAKCVVDSRYKVKVSGNTTYSNRNWSGRLTITNYSDDEDTAVTNNILVTIVKNETKYIQQQLDYVMKNKSNDESGEMAYDIKSIFALNTTALTNKMKEYAVAPLKSFLNAADACVATVAGLDEVIDQTVKNNALTKYRGIWTVVNNALTERQRELDWVTGVLTPDNKVETIGVITEVDARRKTVADSLNMRSYFGETLWKELVAYRREDEYKNDNFVSDGKDGSDLLDEAQEFMDMAEKELYKSATMQHSITSTLKNLLVMKEFEPIVNNFRVGNWIRIRVDIKVYKLRLISYTIDFDNIENFNVEFSDVKECKDGIMDTESIFKQAASMATSFTAVTRQSSKGDIANKTIDGWVERGLSATLMNIVNNAEAQDVIIDESGVLCKHLYADTGDYDDSQLRIINNGLYITKDNWRTLETAVGKFMYEDPTNPGTYKEAYGVIAGTIVGKLILGEELGIYNSGGTLKFTRDGLEVLGSATSVKINPNADNIFQILKGNTPVLQTNTNGDLNITGTITATSLYCGNTSGSSYLRWANSTLTIKAGELYCGSPSDDEYLRWAYDSTERKYKLTVQGSFYVKDGKIGHLLIDDWLSTSSDRTTYNDTNHNGLTITPLGIGAKGSSGYWNLSTNGVLKANNVDLSGKITATSGAIGGFTITNNKLSGGTTGVIEGGKIINNDGDRYQVTIDGGKIIFSSEMDAAGSIEYRDGSKLAGIYLSTNDGSGSGSQYGTITLLSRYLEADNSTAYFRTVVSHGDIIADNGTVTAHYVNSLVYNYASNYEGTSGSVIGWPVISSTVEGKHCGLIQCEIYNGRPSLDVYGEWGVEEGYTMRRFQNATSDSRLKTDIKDSYMDALSLIRAIRHRSFTWINGGAHYDVGYIAQELENLNPLLVNKPEHEKEYYTVDTFYLEAVITKAIQELADENEALRMELQEIKRKI